VFLSTIIIRSSIAVIVQVSVVSGDSIQSLKSDDRTLLLTPAPLAKYDIIEEDGIIYSHRYIFSHKFL